LNRSTRVASKDAALGIRFMSRGGPSWSLLNLHIKSSSVKVSKHSVCVQQVQAGFGCSPNLDAWGQAASSLAPQRACTRGESRQGAAACFTSQCAHAGGAQCAGERRHVAAACRKTFDPCAIPVPVPLPPNDPAKALHHQLLQRSCVTGGAGRQLTGALMALDEVVPCRGVAQSSTTCVSSTGCSVSSVRSAGEWREVVRVART
jgi:hypothetical protein